jgi:hypothetical protein
MPVVRYGQRQVALRGLPGARRTAAPTALSLGAGVEEERARTAQTIAGVAIQGTNIALGMIQEEQKAADEAAFLEASNRFTERLNAWQFDPDSGAYTKKGKDAQALPDEFRDVFTRNASELGTGLSNDRQRAMWSRWLAQQRTSMDLSVKRYVFDEAQAYYAGEVKSSLENVRSTAIANANDPRKVGETLAFGEEVIRTSASRLRLGPEAQEAAIAELRTQVHEGVIGRLLAQGKTAGAQAYFEELKDQIAGPSLERIEKALAEGTVREQTQQALTTILGDPTLDTLEKQRKAAREKYSGELEDRVLQSLEHEDQVRRARDRERIETIMVNSKNIIDRTGRWTDIPPADWAQLDPGEAGALKSYAEHKAQGIAVKTDPATLYRLKLMSVDDEATFVQENLLKYAGVLSSADLEQMMDLQVSVKKGDRKEIDAKTGSFRTRQELFDDTMLLHGFDPRAKPDSADGRAIALTRAMLDRRVEELQRATGKELANEEIRSILDRLLSENVEVKGSLWGSTTKPLVRIETGDISTSRRRVLEETLRSVGRTVDDASLIRFEAEVRSRLGGEIGGNAVTRIPRQDVIDLSAALTAAKRTPTPDAIVGLYLRMLAQGSVR